MATAAIDFGWRRTKLAFFNRQTRASELCCCMPSLVHVARSGEITAGEAAEAASAADPAGAIDDLKLRLDGAEIIRNRRRCPPVELARSLFSELRKRAVTQLQGSDSLAKCCVAVPYQFNLRQLEVLTQSIQEAGFTGLLHLEEPSAAVRHHERQAKIGEDTVVVCDLGGNARLSVLRRREGELQLDLELSTPRQWRMSGSQLSPLLLDGLQLLAARLPLTDSLPPLLLVIGDGGEAVDLKPTLRNAGWFGRILIGHPHAAVLGAVEASPSSGELLICPECQFVDIPSIAKACPNCGFPLRVCPECRSPHVASGKPCPTCGFSLQAWQAAIKQHPR